jgi:hypothetical protein
MLTPAQRLTLKANVESIPEAHQLLIDGNLSGLADYYNTQATPDFTVWKSLVTRDEIMQNGFDWTRVNNLSANTARTWEWMFESGTVNPSKANVRAGIEETWKGTAPDLAVRAQVYVHCKRFASRIEKLFAAGTGSDAVPATMAAEGPIGFIEFVGL